MRRLSEQLHAPKRALLTARLAVLLLCGGLVVLVAAPIGARAAPDAATPSGRVAEWWPLATDGGPIELSGLAPTTEFELDIPPGWSAGADGELILDYGFPALVESAAIGVTFNGEFVDAVKLAPRSGAAVIALPADRFRTGTNSVRVEATISVVDDRECPDPWHPARIVTFGERSRVEVPLVPDDRLVLDQLPDALEPVGVTERTVTVRFGPAPSGEDVTAAVTVIAALRASTEFGVAVGTIRSAGRATGPDILVGVAADLADAGLGVPTAAGGVLQIGRNGAGDARLVISGSTPADILAAAGTIGVAPATTLLVAIDPRTAPEPPVPTERFTLGDLGYPGRDLNGPGLASTVYGFDAPFAVAPTAMTVTVDAVRSASGDEVPGLSVFVNGSRVGTVHFDVDTGATSGIQINVSGDDVRPGRNFLRIEAEFPGPSHDCDQRPPEESVEISASTEIELITNEEPISVDLEDLPYLLRAPTDSADLVVVLPENPTDRDLADAIDIAVLYGDDEFPARVATAGSLDGDGLAGRHVIALGEPSEQPLHDLLPESIVATETDTVRSEQAAIEAASRLNGVIEVVPNPVDPTHVVMVATGFDAAGADLAQRVLLDPLMRGELYGRATFVGGSAENPVLAPVLEPVKIERGEISGDSDDLSTDIAETSAGDDLAPIIGDETIFDAEPPQNRSTIGSLPVGLPLGLVGILGVGALVAGGGILSAHRRRRDRAGATAH